MHCCVRKPWRLIAVDPAMTDPQPRQFSDALFEVVALLESLSIPYVIFGAVAVGVWGRIRSTLDVDFMVLTDDAGLTAIERDAAHAGVPIDRDWLDWNPRRQGIQLRLMLDPFRADIVRTVSAHDAATMERRRRVDWLGRPVWVVSAEDLLLQKLVVQRDYDLADAVTIVEEQRAQLDQVYLRTWAARLGVEDELAYVLGGGTFDFGDSSPAR